MESKNEEFKGFKSEKQAIRFLTDIGFKPGEWLNFVASSILEGKDEQEKDSESN